MAASSDVTKVTDCCKWHTIWKCLWFEPLNYMRFFWDFLELNQIRVQFISLTHQHMSVQDLSSMIIRLSSRTEIIRAERLKNIFLPWSIDWAAEFKRNYNKWKLVYNYLVFQNVEIFIGILYAYICSHEYFFSIFKTFYTSESE